MSSEILFALSTYSNHADALAMPAINQSSWVLFCTCQGRFYHVVLWLHSRVQCLVSRYQIASQSIAWIDEEDTDEHDSDASDALEMYGAYCQSLHCSYAMAIQRAFMVEPAVQCLLGHLVFALEMVRETDVHRMEDADLFFLDLLHERVCGGNGKSIGQNGVRGSCN